MRKWEGVVCAVGMIFKEKEDSEHYIGTQSIIITVYYSLTQKTLSTFNKFRLVISK